MANSVFRGRADQADGHPIQVEGVADNAFLPGSLVKKTATGLAISDQAATVFGKDTLIAKELGENYPDGGIDDAYAIGDGAYAYLAKPNDFFMVRVATGQALVENVTRLASNGDGQFTVAATDGTQQVQLVAKETVTTAADNTLVLARAL